MKKKLFFILLSVMTLSQYAVAINGFWLDKRDGSTIGYLFDQDINISYTTTSVLLTANSVTVEYPFDDVIRMYFDDNVTGISNTTLTEKQQLIRIIANGLELKGFNASTLVTVSDLAGRVALQHTTDTNGLLYIRWYDLPRGVYVVRAGKTTIKFNNK